jgi:ABC-type proline/glycine betaine transport system substrate-binding protein
VIKVTTFEEEYGEILISRYPSEAATEWIEANEQEITNWDPWKVNRKIILEESCY